METSLWITAFATLAAAVLSGLGLGSSGIFVLYLTMVAGYGQLEAQGMNLLFYLLSAGASLIFHAGHRRIARPLVGLLIVCAIPGALCGTYLAGVLDTDLIRRLFGGMLTVSGIWTLTRRKERSSDHTANRHR